MAVKRARTRKAAKRRVVTLHGKRIPAFDADVVMVRVGRSRRAPGGVHALDVARVMIPKAGKALDKPGLAKTAVFGRGSSNRVFAFSVDARDPTRVVREASDGSRRIGRLVGGKFRSA